MAQVDSQLFRYVTDTGERVWLLLPDFRQSVFRAELLAVMHALQECSPHRIVSDCKGVVMALRAVQFKNLGAAEHEPHEPSEDRLVSLGAGC
eukprot:6486475-Amphidinium_carterae.1